MIQKNTKVTNLTVNELEDIISERVRLEMRFLTNHMHQELNKFGEQIKIQMEVFGMANVFIFLVFYTKKIQQPVADAAICL